MVMMESLKETCQKWLLMSAVALSVSNINFHIILLLIFLKLIFFTAISIYALTFSIFRPVDIVINVLGYLQCQKESF